ncbi:GTPase [Amycolatopsis sp. WAC 04197]|uniref:GTPase n=1 Tax=Amycolatopsis sp. WAC 04197 TaxID=2203199 RepID=UPI000F76F3E0|nr:GTPase [Amycolatopsis sp. WAC 04197]RSN42809.1 GTPase [Amycolatopsis sp. WAC 04197]
MTALDVRELLNEAAAHYRDRPHAVAMLRECLERLDEPLRVGFIGTPGTGKSTLVSALAEWPTRALREIDLFDTPAFAEHVDATVRLVRHLEPDELAGTRSVGGSAFARQTAVNSVLVLGRADEVGAGRIDALLTAKQLARRAWRENPDCAGFQGVIAVAGQLGYAGRALRDDEFEVLRALASISRPELERYLLSVDSFVDDPFPVRVSPESRKHLVSRFGLYGVRLAITLIRTGCDSRLKLSAELVHRSGLGDLRDTLAGCFVARAEALKARTAVLRLESLLAAEPLPHGDRLAARVERFAAAAHDFRELRLIAGIRGGRTALSGESAEEAVRLLGAQGLAPTERLGLEPDADPAEIHAGAESALVRWRHEAERADAAHAERAAARVIVRSVEGLLSLFVA